MSSFGAIAFALRHCARVFLQHENNQRVAILQQILQRCGSYNGLSCCKLKIAPHLPTVSCEYMKMRSFSLLIRGLLVRVQWGALFSPCFPQSCLPQHSALFCASCRHQGRTASRDAVSRCVQTAAVAETRVASWPVRCFPIGAATTDTFFALDCSGPPTFGGSSV
jgi:hypothetical protein